MPRCTPRPRPWTKRTSSKPAAAAASTYSATTDGMSRGANACKSSSRSIAIRKPSAISHQPLAISHGAVGCCHDGLDPAADRKVADDGHPARMNRADEVVENLIGDRLVKDPFVAVLDQVVLQRLQLDARRVGHVGDPDFSEIGQPGLRAER